MSKWQDNEIVEIVEDSDMKGTEEEPITEEETNLATMGIMPERAEHYYKRKPKGLVFENGKLTKSFFQWLMDTIDDEELKAIDPLKLDAEQQMMLEETKLKGAIKIEETPLQQYIDKNKELMARNKFLEDESLELKKSIRLYDDIGMKYFSFTKFLYELMGEKMEFKASKNIDNEELAKIEEIAGGLNKK